ncbi:serine/threonine protein kinase [Streptomyces sp. 549]|uniref:serine/threonine protein kinase n=1 Tax=Streptomyces sp. 549 TaxID=3049076 RepID=UPI0024C41339|nr:serine/threonine protein kinase [Streptomyces sp. 549]MDK1472819.1 serine/threonine protein kinase [Streptomyces sp. 549]
MDDYAGRLLAERYRLPLPPSDEYELREARAYDTASGQEVLVRQVPLPEVVDAEVVGEPGGGLTAGRATRAPADPAVRRAVEAALSAARIPDHPRLDQVFDVFVEDDGLWIVSELVAARPLAAVLADRPLSPHRAAEIAADLLAALSAVHTFGWTHRNITARSVLICDDGRALLTGLASGAAEEALCGYDPLPTEGPMAPDPRPPAPPAGGRGQAAKAPAAVEPTKTAESSAGRAAVPHRAARSGAIAAYRAGAAAARSGAGVAEEERPRHGPWGGDKPGPATRAPSPFPADLPAPYTARRTGDGEGPHGEVAYGEGAYGDGGYGDGGYGEVAYADDAHSADPYADDWDEERPGADGQAAPDTPDDEDDERSVAWGAPDPGDDGRYRGPTTALAAERARQARMTMVGAVTERWAPEQAGPVYENWRLAPPVGPAADLWALGALLFRAVQGHAPYPEESVTDLVQCVCSEPPAFAEECGALRPVIESLLRPDPTERTQFEELSGWLRSIIRSAPEPEVGRRTVTAQPLLEPGGRTDPRRLPILRRRGELVRRRKAEKHPVHVERRRHRRAQRAHNPQRLGRLLLVLVLLGLVGAVVYAVAFMPKADTAGGTTNQRGTVSDDPGNAEPAPAPSADAPSTPPSASAAPSTPGSDRTPQSTQPGGPAPAGYTIRDDPSGFRIAVPEGWARGQTSGGQVRFSKGDLEVVVVPGRDGTDRFGTDPRAYQLADQPELAAYRDSNGWKTVSGVRSITVGETAMAEGEFGWEGGSGKVVLRNRAMVLGNKYHVVLVRGPESRQAEIDAHFSQIVDTYRATG